MTRWNRNSGLLAGVLLAALALPSQARAQNPFPLTEAIPADAFIVACERQTPEREFLRNYWSGVFQAFRDSGFLDEILDMALSQMGEQERSEMTRLWTRFQGLAQGVDWSRFGSLETAFGERLAGPLMIQGRFAGLPPDVVSLFRSPDDVAQQAHAAMMAMMIAAVDEVERVAGIHLAMEVQTVGEWQVVSLDLLQLVPDAEPLLLALGQKDDVQFLTFGRTTLADVLDLLTGQGHGRSIADTPDYQAAFQGLPSPEDGMEFFHMEPLARSARALADLAFSALGKDVVQDQFLNARLDEDAMALHQQAYAAYEAGNLKEALRLTQEALAINPADSMLQYNMACLHALSGDPDAAMQWLDRAVEAGFHAPTKIREDNDLLSLRARPGFQEAVDRAALLAGGERAGWMQFARSLADQALDLMDLVDYSATVHTTDGFATRSYSVTALAEDAPRSAFYPVLMSGSTVEDFARHLPQETTSFRVSGSVDPQAVYGWFEHAILEAGPPGQELIGMWGGIQDRLGFHVEEDLLSWMGSTEVNASFVLDGQEAWIWMTQVKDEQVALGQLERALQLMPAAIQKMAAEVPPLALLTMRTRPETAEDLAGFHRVFVGMMAKPALCGVRDGWLVVGSSADAIRRVTATAAGDHPNVLANPALVPHILTPDGPATTVSLTDHRKDAEVMAAILGATSMVGSMVTMGIPDADERATVQKLFSAVGRLAPVVATMNFHETSASTTIFDGRRWITRSVDHYTPPETH